MYVVGKNVKVYLYALQSVLTPMLVIGNNYHQCWQNGPMRLGYLLLETSMSLVAMMASTGSVQLDSVQVKFSGQKPDIGKFFLLCLYADHMR